MEENKYEDSDTDDDYKEVVVNDSDFRREIYEFPEHRDLMIIKSIGQTESEYDYKIEKDFKISTVGTGTVYHVANNVAFVVTCAHNIHHRVFECPKCDIYNKKKSCSKCAETLDSSHKKILKATHIEFKRRNVTENNFGHVEQVYKCDEIYIPNGYEQNTTLQRGFDFAILMFQDDNKYYSKYCKNIQLKIGTNALRSHKRWCVFGYPGTNSGNVKKNKLYGYGMKSDRQENGFELKQCDKPNGNFDNPTKFILRQCHIDASIGQSGSCVFAVIGKSDVIVFGVHVGGHEKQTENDYAYNVATLLGEEYVNTLNNVTDLYTQNVMIHKLRETLTMKDKEINSLKTIDGNKILAGSGDVFRLQQTKLTLLTILLLIVLLLGSNIICYLKYTELSDLNQSNEDKIAKLLDLIQSNEAPNVDRQYEEIASLKKQSYKENIWNLYLFDLAKQRQIRLLSEIETQSFFIAVMKNRADESFTKIKELESINNTQSDRISKLENQCNRIKKTNTGYVQTMETITSNTEYITISNDGKTITSHLHGYLDEYGNSNAYGETRIISTTKNIYTWTFICTKRRGSIIIGIISTRNVHLLSPWKRIDYGYDGEDGYKYNNGTSNKYGMSWNDTDIIEMKVDFLKQEIRYKVNDVDQGVAFNNIKIGHNYYLVVSTGTWGEGNVGDSITINSFTIA
eukprot:211796_1